MYVRGRAEPERQEMTGAGMEAAGLTGQGETDGMEFGKVGWAPPWTAVDARPRGPDPHRQ